MGEWWGPSDNAPCGSLNYKCVCIETLAVRRYVLSLREHPVDYSIPPGHATHYSPLPCYSVQWGFWPRCLFPLSPLLQWWCGTVFSGALGLYSFYWAGGYGRTPQSSVSAKRSRRPADGLWKR